MELALEISSLGAVLHVHWSGFARNFEIERYPGNPKRKVTWNNKTSYGCVSCKEASDLEKLQTFPKQVIVTIWLLVWNWTLRSLFIKFR